MLGTIAGDYIGSVYERKTDRIKTVDFPLFHKDCRFTDDTVLTIATADALMNNKPLAETYKQYALEYPDAGYGKRFKEWMKSDSLEPYNSWGNGGAMRVSPVAYICDSVNLKQMAKETCEVTHNHPEGIRGAQMIAEAVFYALHFDDKNVIEKAVSVNYQEVFDASVEEIRETYEFDSSAKGTCGVAVLCFLESKDYEDCIRKAISLGGDADTLAAIAGGIAEAFYGKVPEHIAHPVEQILQVKHPKLFDVYEKFKCFM